MAKRKNYGKLDPSFVHHACGADTIANVVPAAIAALRTDAEALEAAESGQPNGGALEVPRSKHVTIVLVDGMGSELIERYRAYAPFLSKLASQPCLSAVPSTTASSLASLGTGAQSGAHGLLGYTVADPDTDKVVHHLEWRTTPNPKLWQPLPQIWQSASKHGIATYNISSSMFAGSGLTQAAFSDATFVPIDGFRERLAKARQIAAAPERSLSYVYWRDLDAKGHQYGVDSPQWLDELQHVDQALKSFCFTARPDHTVIITADHGMVDSPADRRIEVSTMPGLLDDVRIYAGEWRFAQLYTDPLDAKTVAARWRDALQDKAQVLLREDALALGLFGEVAPNHLGRIGNVLVAAREDWTIYNAHEHSERSYNMIGQHGSLTAAERNIPLFVVPGS